MVFQAFLKPVINGHGFDFKEPQISEERRLDIVVTWGSSRYVVELKLWRGLKAHEEGLRQLEGYLERTNLSKGYLVIFDTLKQKKHDWSYKTIRVGNKEIFMILV
ncbi:MAG: PD-(D/E)XK nuclease family protein [bacterium]|nr:PD-(D/E)XK nuclease family protein [bacterium]